MKKWKSKLLSSKDRNASEIEPGPSILPTQTATSRTVSAPTFDGAGAVPPDPVLEQPSLSHIRSSYTRQSKVPKIDIQRETSDHGRKRSRDRRSDPLGLTLLHTPEGSPTADIIFVHGLGGTSRQSWSYKKNAELFWPQIWLPKEQDISTARILTFGYNAHFLSTGPNSVAGIRDFAKSLLFSMKFGKDNNSEDLGIGKWPIIFVVHSMGGLVFKSAYIQGQHNDGHKNIVDQVRAVLFLSTPHRGTDLAQTLNRILSVSVFDHSPKQYINELRQNSPLIQDINEDFRNYASKLEIFSFYETLKTAVGPKSMLVLQKTSSTLGYPEEVSQPLNADHHQVCKHPSQNDPNYKSVTSVLKTLVSKFRANGAKVLQKQLDAEMETVSELLGVFSSPEDDLRALLDLWRPGTCESSLASPDIIDWKTSQTGSKILWVHAQPGSGKSVKLAVHAKDLKENGYPCSYYFFKYGDSTKRSPGSLLRSLAFQIARDFSSFRAGLIALNESGMQVEKMEARMILEKLFVGMLFRLDLRDPIYLLIDALDESDSINTIVMFLSGIAASKAPIRIMLTSRKTPDITTAMDRISSKVSINAVAAASNINDIRIYSEGEMEYMHGENHFKQQVVDKIVERVEGNFLWVHLALKEILQCHSHEDVQEVLSEMPPGMEALYKRMEATISSLSRPSDLTMAKIILSWATYSRLPLTVDELVRALQPGTPSIIDLRYTISQLCGHFVVVDGNNHVTLVHQTAKEYLTKLAVLPFSLDSEEIQEALFRKALGIFLEPHTRTKLVQKPLSPFYDYAATSWAYHLDRSSAGSDASLSLVVKFLQSPAVLLWIRLLAASHQLTTLIMTSDALHAFVKRRKMMYITIPPAQHRLTDLETLEKWAVDLLKLIGQFGSYLLEDPGAIQAFIPQFCPKNSAIFLQFGKQAKISVKSISNDDWDDCLGRVSIRSGHRATQIICSARHLAVVTSGGAIVLWSSITFEEFRSLSHDEHIFAACFSENGDTLASYGYKTTKVWSVLTGELIHQITNQPESRALAITFAQDNSKLTVGLNTRSVAEVLLEEMPKEWTVFNSSFLQEETVPDSSHGIYLNAPTDMAFNSDVSYLVVSYRGFPMALWGMIEQKQIKRCRRRPDHDHQAGQAWTGVYKVVWHPNNEEVLGIYTDGAVFKWNPFEDLHEELRADTYAAPSNIQISPNGVIFATSDAENAVKLYNYEHFSLIYQLSSEDYITSLSFSPDSRRFYDVRGSYCNIWEPNVLLRLPDIDERGSAIDTEVGSAATSSHAAEAWVEMSVPITALASQIHGSLFCYGNEEGLVSINDATAFGARKVGSSRGEMSIQFIEWADDGQTFAYSDGDTVIVKKMNHNETDQQLRFDTVLDFTMNYESGKVHQIHLNYDSTLVLVVEMDSVMVWSSGTKKLSKPSKNLELQKWANHPKNRNQLLAFAPHSITSYSWESLEILSHWVINSPTNSLETTSAVISEAARKTSAISNPAFDVSDLIEDVIFSQECLFALILTSRLGSYQKRSHHLTILDLSHLQETGSSSLDPIIIPEGITSSIERPLTILGKDHFAFINKSYWVCSWRLGSTGPPVKHFFLPRDWVSADILDLCKVMEGGTFLCPRKGEVAVIRSTLGRQF